MQHFTNIVTRANTVLGHFAAWLCLALVFLQVVIVLNRYCFGYSSLLGWNMIYYEEALLYLFSAIFLFGAALTYVGDGHVRVDIFYAGLPPARQALVDIFGNLCLALPLMLLIVLKSNRSIDMAWSNAEGSIDGGLPLVYLWQTMLPLFALSMALQAVANSVALSLRFGRRKRRLERIWAAILLLFSLWLFAVAFGWAPVPDWTQPEPAWRFTVYWLGVWITRLLAAGAVCWFLAVLVRPSYQPQSRRG
ncbi:TRAP transporter small permease subunit [Roseovarius sp.]|uniref:TRAP transporter small permease subunit n=1 Tax=Roseovarius sp. TaxID=1486281 RepID=UPI003B5C0CB9